MTMKISDIANYNVLNLDQDKLFKTVEFEGTLVVPAESSALDVAAKVTEKKALLVVITDEQGTIRGIVEPKWITKQINKHRHKNLNSFYDALQDMEDDPEEALRKYQHEWLTFERPILVWCEKGEHYVESLPCHDHS
jgi:hypothetical protein